MRRQTNNTTNIHNYNKFLLTLDKKSVDISNNVINTNKQLQNQSEKDMKMLIDRTIKNLNNDFSNKNYISTNFTGQSINDYKLFNMRSENPNDYKELKENKDYKEKKEYKSYNSCCLNVNEKIIHKEAKIYMTNTETNIEIKETINIQTEINSISDILKLIETYKADHSIQYNINMKALHNIKKPLQELDNMIGIKELKNNIIDQILYFVQDLHKDKKSTGDFMHTVIYGHPGTGKTEIAKIMGKIYSKLGILNKGTFKKVTRSDLIAGYLGQTALKTKDVIKEAIGGVLFIDEAYSLGNSEKKDIFAKECIDTLCEALSDHKDNLMVIIAGYENELKECFFEYNQGLDSRFTWRFKTDDYDHNDLYKIFLKKVNDIGWEIEENSGISSEWFKKNKDYFKFYGRDIETILAKTKIAHSRRIFCKLENEKRKIILTDLENGFKMFLKNENIKNRENDIQFKKNLYNTLYS